MTPDDLYYRGSFTIIYIPENGYIDTQPFPITHSEMLNNAPYKSRKGEINDIEAVAFKRYLAKNNNKMPLQDKFTQIRYDYQNYGDVFLGRARYYPMHFQSVKDPKKNTIMDVSIWPTSDPTIFSNENITKFLKILIDDIYRLSKDSLNHIEKINVYFQTSKFNQYSTGRKLEKKLTFNTDKYITNLSLNKEKEENEENEENEDKFYIINRVSYKLSDLQERRAKVHLGGSGAIDSVLCAIDLKKYPELIGYKPNNCIGKVIPKNPFKYPALNRGKNDPRGTPYWRTTSEGLNFSQWMDLF